MGGYADFVFIVRERTGQVKIKEQVFDIEWQFVLMQKEGFGIMIRKNGGEKPYGSV